MRLSQHFFIGVDGGATKSVLCLQDEAGHSLGQAVSGPANIRLSVTQAWQSIHQALENVLHSAGIVLTKDHILHAGLGLAGCEVRDAYQAFLAQGHAGDKPFFTTLVVASDAYTACLGAHGGQDGAIIIAGTGVVGLHIQQGQTAQVGGYGFPHDDEGGGAWLGLKAIQATLQWLDGRLAQSGLVQAVYRHFSENKDALIQWANQANSTAFATLAPLVIEQAHAGDTLALNLLKQAAAIMDTIAAALVAQQQPYSPPLPCAMVGGIVPFLQPYLGCNLKARLKPCLFSPSGGAIFLVRQHLKSQQSHIG